MYEGKLLTQQVNNHINSISPGDCETRKKRTYQARAALDEAQKRGGKLTTTQQKPSQRQQKLELENKGREKEQSKGPYLPTHRTPSEENELHFSHWKARGGGDIQENHRGRKLNSFSEAEK